MSSSVLPHGLAPVAVFDCLLTDAAGVMPLYRDVIARTGLAPEVEPFLRFLFGLCDRGLLRETLPDEMTRADALAVYARVLPTTPLSALVAETVGAIYEPTALARTEWERWRTSFVKASAMRPSDPTTWDDLAAHPRFAGKRFDPAWYEGDAGADLARIRACAIDVLAALPGATCELVVLDDCTTFVRFHTGTREADVYPVVLDNGAAGFYVGFPNLEELRVAEVGGVIAALR
jgi:hypothetical protein